MRVTQLPNTCSMVYLSGFANISTPEAFVKEVEAHLKSTTEKQHAILVIGPRQEIAQKGINILRGQKRAKRLHVLDTGHGGDTKIWMVYNNFRGKPIPA